MIDYYEIEDEGCCLHCPDAEPGCLCYNCKCSKCEHYSGNDPDADVKNEDTGGEICLLTLFWEQKRNREFEEGQLKSNFKINKTLRQTEKAIQCTLINIKTGEVSDTPFWVPLSVIVDNHVKVWFADKEVKLKFEGDVEPQRKLF